MITAAVHQKLVGDPALVSMLSQYNGEPAVFTTDPAPGDAVLPYIVTAGSVSDLPFDTKLTRGRAIVRDVRCYAAAGGTGETIREISEKVRELLHRVELNVSGFDYVFSVCNGPINADELDSYGRIVTLNITIQEI